MVTQKTTSLHVLFVTAFATLSLSSALYSSQVNSLSASQAVSATSTASSSTATSQSSSSIADSKKAESSSSSTKVTITLLISTRDKHTFTLPQDDFDLLQKIFTFKKLTGNNNYTIANYYEYEAARIALNYLSKDEDSAEKELLDYVMKNSEKSNSRAAWHCFCDCSIEFGNQIGDPHLEKYPRLQRLGQALSLWLY